MKGNNPYIESNNWINEILSSPGGRQKIDFDKIIHKVSCLPIPDTDEKYQTLIDSELGFSLSDLAAHLINNPESEENFNRQAENNDMPINRLNSYLTNLWEIWEKHFIRYSWYHYSSHLIRNEQFNKKLSILNYHYNKLFNKCNDCQKTSIKIPSSNKTSPMLHLNNLGESRHLSTMTLTGCEGFVYASEKLKNEYVFERVYSHWRAPNIHRMQLLWIPFILCAGELKRVDILTDILQLMKTAYREIDFTNAIVLLRSARKAGAKEIIDYFGDLNSPSQWDLLTPYNPVLDSMISAFSIKDDSAYSWMLEYRSFEGEFWIKYFKNYLEGNFQEGPNLYGEHKRLLQFPNKNINDWYTTLCFAQETYVRELRSQMYDEFQRQFSHYDYLNKDKFLSEIISGNVSSRIKKYQEKINTLVLHEHSDYLRDEVLEGNFLPFIDCLLSTHLSFFTNRENYYRWQNDNDVQVSFFKKAEELFKNINSETVTDKEWQYFIHLLTNLIQNNVAGHLSNIFLSEFHSIKRIFVEKYEKVFQNKKVRLSDKYELLTDARTFIKNISLLIPKYRITQPQHIDIISQIEQYLLIDPSDIKGNVSSYTSNIHIAGYDGICEDYLRPMLIEIHSNAKRALSKIEKSELWHYEVNLDYGENDYSGFLILSVTNNFSINKDDSVDDPVSTGIGLKNIQYYATFFQRGELQGWAQFNKVYKNKYGYFTVYIYFPLWKN